MVHRLSLLLLLLCSAIVAPATLGVSNMKAWGIQRGPLVNGSGFVMVYCNNRHIGTTEVKNNTRDPVWEEHFWYRYASPGNRLILRVYDKDVVIDDRLGICKTKITTGSYKLTCNLFTGGQLEYKYILF